MVPDDALTPAQLEDRGLALRAELPADEADRLAADPDSPDGRAICAARFGPACRAEMRSAMDAAGIPRVDPSEWACREGESVPDWHDRQIALYGGHLPLIIPGGSDPAAVCSIDLGTMRRRDRERLLRRRPNQLRRHVLRALRPPVCRGARPRTAPRPRGRRSRSSSRSARGSPSGSDGPGKAGPHDVGLRGRCSS